MACHCLMLVETHIFEIELDNILKISCEQFFRLKTGANIHLSYEYQSVE